VHWSAYFQLDFASMTFGGVWELGHMQRDTPNNESIKPLVISLSSDYDYPCVETQFVLIVSQTIRHSNAVIKLGKDCWPERANGQNWTNYKQETSSISRPLRNSNSQRLQEIKKKGECASSRVRSPPSFGSMFFLKT